MFCFEYFYRFGAQNFREERHLALYLIDLKIILMDFRSTRANPAYTSNGKSVKFQSKIMFDPLFNVCRFFYFKCIFQIVRRNFACACLTYSCTRYFNSFIFKIKPFL